MPCFYEEKKEFINRKLIQLNWNDFYARQHVRLLLKQSIIINLYDPIWAHFMLEYSVDFRRPVNKSNFDPNTQKFAYCTMYFSPNLLI